MRVFTCVLSVAYALTIAVLCSGCSSSAGWRVEFGVSPVNSLDNRAQFAAAEEAEAEEGNVRRTTARLRY